MKISLSNMIFYSKQSRTLFKGLRSITISLPEKNILNTSELERSLMPNLIHSMDAANIHNLVNKLIVENIKIPLFTIHDCFASTPNNMNYVNNLVKDAFADLYFNENYLLKMHNNLIEQIISFNNDNLIIKKIDGKTKISFLKNDNCITFPELPDIK